MLIAAIPVLVAVALLVVGRVMARKTARLAALWLSIVAAVALGAAIVIAVLAFVRR